MSVINNVLKDLESRESRFTPIDITSVATQPAARPDRRPLLIGLLLLALLALAGWIYLQPRPLSVAAASTSTVKPDNARLELTDTVIQPLPTAAVEVERVAANQIVGLQLHESEQEMRMEFVLREKVVAYLKERGENSFGYHLRRIGSQIVAPTMTDNRWIRGLTITPTADGVDVNFSTETDILVETRQNLVDGEPVWSINLRKADQPTDPKSEIVVAAVAALSATETADVADAAPAPLAEETIEASTPAESAAPSAAAVEAPVVKLEIRSTNPNVETENQLEYAIELIRSGRSADAEKLLQGLIGGNEDHSARQHLLALYSRQNRGDRFARLLQQSMTRYPQDQLFRTEHARALFQNAAYRDVIQLFSADSSLDASQQSLLAASYQRLDEHEDAIRHYRLALELDAGNAKNWVGLGISQEHTAALPDALASYQQAATLGTLNGRLRAFVDKRSDTLRQVLN